MPLGWMTYWCNYRTPTRYSGVDLPVVNRRSLRVSSHCCRHIGPRRHSNAPSSTVTWPQIWRRRRAEASSGEIFQHAKDDQQRLLQLDLRPSWRLQHVTLAVRHWKIHTVSRKNAPILRSCSFVKHSPIFIMFGTHNQHTLENVFFWVHFYVFILPLKCSDKNDAIYISLRW